MLVQIQSWAQSVKKNSTSVLFFSFVRRKHVALATAESGSRVLSRIKGIARKLYLVTRDQDNGVKNSLGIFLYLTNLKIVVLFAYMKVSLLYLFIGFLLFPNSIGAFYTQETYWNTDHEQPAWFESDSFGGFYGETVGGTPFTQKPIINSQNIKLHKFAIGSAFFYISDKGIIKAEGDLGAISIYLSIV